LEIVAGLAFSLGLILVIVSGAELFTGIVLLVMGLSSRRIATRSVLRNWTLVFAANLVGALGTVALVVASGWYELGGGSVGTALLATAEAKAVRPFGDVLMAGILCNALVCLAVWLTYSARTTTDKILAIVPPITAFVAAGFEHSIANMYFIPMGLFIKAGAPPEFWAKIGKTAADYGNLTWDRFLINNLLPVTIGNIIGGAGLVGLAYWFAYLRTQND
jgi:formate/nitrite transporter